MLLSSPASSVFSSIIVTDGLEVSAIGKSRDVDVVGLILSKGS